MPTAVKIEPIVYSNGPCHCSVCVPKEMTREAIEEWVNNDNPTGISSPWKISDEMTFRQGNPNPCPCEKEPETRLHYLMVC